MENQKKYNIIYADPPWRYEQNTLSGAAENHYPTMSMEELYDLPVKEIADQNAMLFLWATFPMLKEAISLIETWGFHYTTVAFVWIKLNKKKPTPCTGLGFWTRSNAEICLLGKKGTLKRQSTKVHQLIFSPRQEHSQKPAIVRDKIIELLGDLPRIELFARETASGWDAWGNEVPCSISLLPE